MTTPFDPRSGTSRVLFLHANGFPSGVYRQFLAALRQVVQVDAPEIINTPSATPASQRWSEMSDQVLVRLDELSAEGERVILVGHSMGGYLSLLAAARTQAKVAAVILIDSPLVLGWRRPLFESMRAAGLTRYGGPAPVAARRRFQWASADHARDHLSSKPFVRKWADGVLDDFIEHALTPSQSLTPEQPDELELRISREIERDIYATLPGGKTFTAYKQLARKGVPVHMIAGKRSREMKMAGAMRNRSVFKDHWMELDAGHLIPFELPELCAEAVSQIVLDVDQTKRPAAPG